MHRAYPKVHVFVNADTGVTVPGKAFLILCFSLFRFPSSLVPHSLFPRISPHNLGNIPEIEVSRRALFRLRETVRLPSRTKNTGFGNGEQRGGRLSVIRPMGERHERTHRRAIHRAGQSSAIIVPRLKERVKSGRQAVLRGSDEGIGQYRAVRER